MIIIGNKYLKSPIPWIGGKAALREIILKSIPLGCNRYIEVFGGGGTILLGKQPHKFEVYNDFNGDLVNLFTCIKDKPLSFFKEAGFFPMNSRQEFVMLRDFMEQQEPEFDRTEYGKQLVESELKTAEEFFNSEELKEITNILQERAGQYDVKRAVAFYKLLHYSYGGGGRNFGGQPLNLANALENIYAVHKRFQKVVIENKDFEALIKIMDRPDSFFYLDPPYVETEGHYDVAFKREDHIRLCEALKRINGKFLLSYNDCEFVKELYEDFYIVEVSRLNFLAQRHEAGSMFKEVLIANYDINERRKTEPVQLSLFEGDNYYERDYLQDYRQKRANNYTYIISYGLKDNQ